MADNRKFLDQAGLVTLVQGLNTRYEGLYFHKADFSAENMAFQHDNLNGGKDTNVKEALKVLVDNVVRQVNDAAVLSGNMQAVEAKIDLEITRATNAEKDLQDAIKEINEQLGNEDLEGGSITGAIAAEEQARKDADTALANRIAVFEADGAKDVAALTERVVANETFVAAQPGVDSAQNDRIKALEDANAEGGAVAEAIKAVADDLADFEGEQATKEAAQDDAIATKVAQTDYNAKVAEIEGDIDDLESFVSEHSHEAIEGDIDALEAKMVGLKKDTVQAAIDDAETAAKAEAAAAQAAADALEQRLDVEGGLVDRIEANEAKLAGLENATVKAEIEAAQAAAEKHADDAITALVDSAPDAMNTLNELAEAINANKGVYDAYVEQHATAMAQQKADLQAEIDADVKVEKERAEGQEAAIRQEFAAADTALHTTISAEIDADVKVVADALADEATAREAADDELSNRIAAFEEGEGSVAAQVEAVQGALDEFKETQEAKDGAQDDKIDALEEVVGAPEDSADADTVFGAIAAEAARAGAKEEELQNAIDAINNTETGILKQAKDYADTQDAAQLATINEALAAKAAAADLDALEAAVGTVPEGKNVVQMIADLQADVDQNEADCDAAIATEKQRAEAAEKANADAITAIKDGAVMDSFADVEAEFAKFGALDEIEIDAAIAEAFGETQE